MRMRMLLGAVLVLTLMVGSAMAATIPVGENGTSMQLVTESRGGLNFHVEVGQILAQDIATQEGNFARLTIPGFHTSKLEGQPELPMMNQLVAIPLGARYQVNVSNVQTRLVKLADYGIASPVFPSQPSVSKSADLDNLPFVYDRSSYAKGAIQPELAQIVPQGRLRAMDFGRLEVSPVTYYPETGELEIVESMDVSIVYSGENKAAADELYAKTYSPFFAHLYADLAGSKAFQDDYPDRVADQVTYVIVTPPMFAAQLADFVQWKTERGFEVIMAVTGTPEVGSTTASIQTYLHDLYNNATVDNPAPSFVLFVGDVAQMPTFSESGDATDRPYCAVDADLVPDMYYGRFSATNPDELQAQLDKTMMYDQYTMSDPSYLANVTMIAGVDSGYAPSHGNGQINYGTEHYFNASHGITSNTYLYPLSSTSVEGELIGTYNDGVGYVNYTAHGSPTSWADPSLSISDINALTNNEKYFLAVGNCCETSTYDYGECFGEAFLRAPNKGAVGYIGGSNSTYWDEDYWWGVGYHASSEIDGTAYPVESTGIGAYDGVFHENGEPEHLHYVTNDAMVFSGNLAIMESGSSRTTYYWNIYNLLGDPSISTYMGVPSENAVGHIPTIFMGQTALDVTAEPGTYVGLTQDGVLVGSGTVGLDGMASIEYTQLLTPGIPVKMVAMAQNKVPYMADIMVIVPAQITIDPMVIDVNTTTDITVTIMDSDGVYPQPGINVWAEGLGYSTAPVMTDASGVAVITVNYAFGPTLDIVGQDPAESYRLFTEQVAVNAMDLTTPDLTVSTDIGLSDAFALNLPGYLHASVGEAGGDLFAMLPDGSVVAGAGYDMTLTPEAQGQVTGIIAVSGYNVYSEAFDIIEAYGTLAGNVTTGGTAMAGVTVTGLDEFGGTVFTSVTDASGNYATPEEVLVDTYALVVDHFGYLHFEQDVFVGYGANTFDIALTAAPSGVLSGVVIDADSMEPLQATIRVYRTDTGDLYTETLCAEDGTFATSALPYFDYEVRVRAWHHVPVSLTMTIEEAEVVKNFALLATNGDLLLINDGGAKDYIPAKMGGKRGDELLAEGYTATLAKSATQMTADLEEMGYFVTVVDAAEADPATFWDYDLVILSCSNNTETLENTALQNGLVTFAQDGGHILLEGGELGYDHYGSGDFATYVMHSNDWNHDSSGNVNVADDTSYMLNNPNPACTPITITYAGYGDSDAMVPLPDAAMPMNWSEYPTDAAVITYDPNPAPEGGQIVFFCWNYLAADQGRYALLENAVQWLLTPEIGNCSISGQAMLSGMTDHSGITVKAIPNGGTATTDASGMFHLPGLYAGTYQVIAEKEGWAPAFVEVTMADGEVVTGMSLVLTESYETEACSSPALAIVDNSSATDMVTIDTQGIIAEVEVDMDITHTYRGDLTLTLTSPAGTPVILHNRTGSSADDIYGTYPVTLAPAEDLAVFMGEQMEGDWTLTVADGASGDTGTLNNWCLRITYLGTVGVQDQPESGDSVPSVFALHGNYPNPFNPMTSIKFDLPKEAHVKVTVYDVAGRLVKTLVDEVRPAATHTVIWDGTDRTGRRVASGAYYYVVKGDTFSDVDKMMLLK